MISSTPFLQGFDPRAIVSQAEVIKLVRKDYDYEKGVLEVLLSGSVGSSKTLLMAHLGVTHCMMFKGARLLVGRKTMPSLKKTILQAILNHISKDLVENVDYWHNKTSGEIKFKNGAEIIPLSWADKNYEKFRSYEFSAALIEELTENDSDEWTGLHTEMIGRVGRINSGNSDVTENFIIYATNPDSPSHSAYDYFIKGSLIYESRHVFYSLTRDNPFLPLWYIPKLEETYDSKTIQRMLEGKWIHIGTDVIYHQYDSQKHFVLNTYNIDIALPLKITFDFNIGEGKPISCALAQHDGTNYVCFDEVILPGSRTMNLMDEIISRGYLDIEHNPIINIHGDSTGRNRDTRSVKSDYDIITETLSNYQRKDKKKIQYKLQVPRANPPIRTRHNLLNGVLCNSKGLIRMALTKKCKKLDEGLTKTTLVKTGSYTEDDSKDYQHVTTAVGYMVCYVEFGKKSGIIQTGSYA